MREAVEEVIESAMIDGWHSMEPGTSLWKHNVQQHARAAISAFAEAMLSDEVAEAFHGAEAGYEYDVLDGWLQAHQAGMRAALKKAFGADDKGESSCHTCQTRSQPTPRS